MRLSLLENINSNLKVISDCEVDALGLATSNYGEKKVLSFLADIKYLDFIQKNECIVAVICTEEIYNNKLIPDNYGIVITPEPKQTFFEIHNILAENEFYWKRFKNRISETANISNHAIIGEHSIQIGHNTVIEPGVVIHPGTIIGDNVIIRSGTQVGSNGFQFINNGKEIFSVKTAGRTIIKDNVEVQHNCCVDRGILGGDTILGNNVKLDNFVHIAHDDYIGDRTFITAGAKLAGRVIVGKDCWIGVNATISNGINIGDNCKITLGSVVTRDVPSGSTVTGNFAIDHKKFIEFIKSIR